jgi:hypothetical protein
MFFRNNQKNSNIFYYIKGLEIKHSQPTVSHRTIIWLGEEIHQVNCELNILLVEHGDFISEGFELIPGLFQKLQDLLLSIKKNNLVKTISVKSGLVYEGKKFRNTTKRYIILRDYFLEHYG